MDIGSGGNNGYQYDPAKGVHFTEWWKKTVLKNALKFAPKSSELVEAMDKENNIEFPQETNESAQSVLDQMAKDKASKPLTIEGDYEEHITHEAPPKKEEKPKRGRPPKKQESSSSVSMGDLGNQTADSKTGATSDAMRLIDPIN